MPKKLIRQLLSLIDKESLFC